MCQLLVHSRFFRAAEIAMEGMDMSRFRGRVAVVTGAAGGLGSAITEGLALAGMRVVAVDRAEAALKVALGGRSSMPGVGVWVSCECGANL